jgi:hypothetical protein
VLEINEMLFTENYPKYENKNNKKMKMENESHKLK